MRIHSDVLTLEDFYEAGKRAGASLSQFSEHGSRSRAKSWDVFYTGHGRSGGQWGNTSGRKTASWDEWGMILHYLYKIDPDLTNRFYANVEEFDWVTAGRFDILNPEHAHHAHRWQIYTVGVFTCKCGAELWRRRP